jgi:RNA polymerase sigma-70 factor (ECF subfamily)
MRFQDQLEPCRLELMAYCRHLLWRREDLEDAVQEVVLQAFRAFPRYSPGDFKRWLFQIATHTVYNLNRKHRDYPAAVPEPETGAEAELQLEEAYETVLRNPAEIPFEGALAESLARLTENERSVLLLRSICDFKYQEIASTLSIPIGSVMGHLARARMKIRKVLAERRHAM